MFDRADEITLELLSNPVIASLLLAVAVSLIFSIGAPRSEYKSRFVINLRRLTGYSIPIILLGFVSGYLTGISRVAAVGSLIPAVLTLVSGVSVYLFRTKSNAIASAIAYSLFMFGFSIFYGIQVGAFEREYKQTARFIFLSDQEREIRTYRFNHELPSDPPNWILGISKD
jgi:hypothetical protein